jgi:hypothetical protein
VTVGARPPAAAAAERRGRHAAGLAPELAVDLRVAARGGGGGGALISWMIVADRF